MGILPNQYPTIWEGICWWMKKIEMMKGIEISPAVLARLTGFPLDRIQRGVRDWAEPITSDFIHNCVDVFGLRNARNRSFEDTADSLSDEECIELLTAPLKNQSRQGNFWD
jgi:hypothetical protein